METSVADGQHGTETIDILLVTSPACHFCEEAAETLVRLSGEFPLEVRAIDIRSDEGAEILRLHRPPMQPVVLVDGEFFSSGRLPLKKLRRRLANRVEKAGG